MRQLAGRGVPGELMHCWGWGWRARDWSWRQGGCTQAVANAAVVAARLCGCVALWLWWRLLGGLLSSAVSRVCMALGSHGGG